MTLQLLSLLYVTSYTVARASVAKYSQFSRSDDANHQRPPLPQWPWQI